MKTAVLLLSLLAGSCLAQNNNIIEEEDLPLVPAGEEAQPPQSQLPPYFREVFGNMKGFSVNFDPESPMSNSGPYGMGWPGVPGKNGIPGKNGLNGLIGPMGEKGERGEAGIDGLPGAEGVPGMPGAPGMPGLDGLRGPKGEPASRLVGPPTLLMGRPGSPGFPGAPGPRGPEGAHGQQFWKQCSWTETSDLDSGVIKSCTFHKSSLTSWLKVTFGGNLRVGGCTNCCRRWFFTFNGTECRNPDPIDAAVYMVGPTTANPLRPRQLEGYCGQIPAGLVNVEFRVGNCKDFGTADAFSGFGSTSRIIIEEVKPPQE